MATGITETGTLQDSMNSVVASARIVREQTGIMSQLSDLHNLDEGSGETWNEVTFAKLAAQAVTELSDLDDNPQQLSDSNFAITPTLIGISTFVTDKLKRRMSRVAWAQIGTLSQNAIQRKKDIDGLTVLDGATTSLGGAGTTLTSGHISSAVSRITSNTTEPGPAPIRCVLHGFQIKDLQDELVAGVGTYGIPDGPTADVFKMGWRLPIAGADIYEDGNITIDIADDAKGGVFSAMSIVLIQEMMTRAVTVRKENLGGGGDAVYVYDGYAFGERSSGNWLYEIYSDATAPTS